MIHAAMRAHSVLEGGDMEERAIWLRALRAVNELTDKGPREVRMAVH